VSGQRGGARSFYLRVVSVSAVVSIATVLLISAYLLLLVRLPAEQWRGFSQIVAVLFVVLFAGTTRVNHSFLAPIVDHLRAEEEGRADERGLRAAFEAISRLPLRMFLAGIFWWTLGGVLVASGMTLRYASFQYFPFAVMALSAASLGFVSSIFMYFIFKSLLRETVVRFATEIGDPQLRGRLVRPLSLAHKLFVSVSGVIFVTVTFGMFLAFVEAGRRLESRSTEIQAAYLEEVAPALASGQAEAFEDAARRAQRLGIASALLLVDAKSGRTLAGPQDLLFEEELAWVRSAGERGDSAAFDSPNTYAWRRIDGDRIAVAVLPWELLGGASASVSAGLAAMLLLSAAISFALSRALARDVAAAILELREGVERMASGDLRPHGVFESEDELGQLARAFEEMVAALRSIVGRVAEAADRVESTAGGIDSVSKAVSEGAATQGRGVEEAALLMEGMSQQESGIATSATELNQLVEESSSSILEMGAAGEQLNETAGVLSSRVDEVSSSIGEMVQSVKEVGSNTDGLSEAAADTSSSMEQMASAMRQVDATAEQTAQLSQRVVRSAEVGQAKVRETIEGMRSIHSASETAERVIRGLGERAVEIGAILDVIDDVADETNLLALNAAIIAAQAGEHGRAFSVVAEEIKELADRVLASTKEIGDLIRSVQEESSKAVGAVEEGSRSVASGVALALEAGTALEEITQASRDSGSRIYEIVRALREQTKAAAHVVSLMERVNTGVEGIQRAIVEQERGHGVAHHSSEAMREMALQLRSTTEEQFRGGARIRASIDGVRDAALRINQALQAQSGSHGELRAFLLQVADRTRSNEQSAHRMEEAMRELIAESETLRDQVRRFEL
jgi:methyl-accepting chemotaxis protein